MQYCMQTVPVRCCLCRLREDGQGEIDSVKAKIDKGGEAQAGLEAEIQSKDADIQTLQASGYCAHVHGWHIQVLSQLSLMHHMLWQ